MISQIVAFLLAAFKALSVIPSIREILSQVSEAYSAWNTADAYRRLKEKQFRNAAAVSDILRLNPRGPHSTVHSAPRVSGGSSGGSNPDSGNAKYNHGT